MTPEEKKEYQKQWRLNNQAKIKAYRLLNKDKLKEKRKVYISINKDKIKIYMKQYRLSNKEKSTEYNKQYHIKNREKINVKANNYNLINKDKIKKYVSVNRNKINITRRIYENYRFKTDPIYNLISRLRTRTRQIIKKNNFSKSKKFYDYIGCTGEELYNHIEKQFTKGMSWDRLEEIHIDHIIPLASAKTEEELFRLCHYTNLQPLWAEDNIKKGNKF